MSAPISYFVTGTDTEVGKTLVASALVNALVRQGLRVAAMKPVAAGARFLNGEWHNEDVDILSAEANVNFPRALTTPYLLRDATAPHIAAAQEEVDIDIAQILSCYDQVAAACDAVVVEGVGGFRVPLSFQDDTADQAQHLGLPVILVVGLRLGCLSHALLTAEAIAARGLKLAGWVANVVDAGMHHSAANVESLVARLPAPLLGSIPRLPDVTPSEASHYLDFSILPGWPHRSPTRSISP
jgi:dethiobiotin synthetase